MRLGLLMKAIGKGNAPEPLTMTAMLKRPCDEFNIDFYGPIPSGEYLLVLIDSFVLFVFPTPQETVRNVIRTKINQAYLVM